MLLKFLSSYLVGTAYGDCRSDGRFFTTTEWEQPEADGKNHHFDGHIKVDLPGTPVGNWEIEVDFTHSVVGITFGETIWDAIPTPLDADMTSYKFTSPSGGSLTGSSWEFNLLGRSYETDIAATRVTLCSPDDVGGDGLPITTDGTPTDTPNTGPTSEPIATVTPPLTGLCNGPDGNRVSQSNQAKIAFKAASGTELGTTKYDLNEVLHKSILFYEAQRTGVQPSGNRILWRGDAALHDGCDVNDPLYGGWFDAGDHVKFGFPMAWTATVLGWGLIDYEAQYKDAGEWVNAIDGLRWSLEYFIRAHTSKFELWGQVGDGNADHAFWGRPEDMSMYRPAFKIDAQNPGSDLAGETAAALAAGAMVFRDEDPAFSAECLAHAKELFEFAETYKGVYTDSIPQAADFYNSWSGYGDELAWGAAWLYRATEEPSYLSKADSYFSNHVGEMFSWDDKTAGYQVLLAQLTTNSDYASAAVNYYNWLTNSAQRTPKGLLWLSQWGSNRYSANAAFLLMQAKKIERINAGDQDAYFNLGKDQIRYMLGDSGRSFMIGFGNNPPERPHHRGSSCPAVPQDCNNGQNNPGPNPFILYGALVGGPDQWDNYVDDRGDYVANEVACDYNAGFQSAVAALKTEVV